MNKTKPYLSRLWRDPRALTFGLAVFSFSWICWRAPGWDDYKLLFLSGTLLVASFLTLFKSVRSNFVAAALGGCVPMEIAYMFWMVPQQAEVPFFSLRHLTYFASMLVEADGSVLLFLALSLSVLACSARTLKRLASG